MRTEEEAKYDLDQNIFDMYDSGLGVDAIAKKLAVTPDYISAVLENAPIESK